MAGDVKTRSVKAEEVERQWWVVSAAGKRLGRLAARIAHILRGKHKPYFTPHVDCGDYVIVTDAEKVVLTGRKLDKKIYYRHSGYPGHLKEETARHLLERAPERVIYLAVKGMLPKGPLGRRMLKKLKVYRGPEHPHAAQQPKPLEL